MCDLFDHDRWNTHRITTHNNHQASKIPLKGGDINELKVRSFALSLTESQVLPPINPEGRRQADNTVDRLGQ